ncbi:MAG TPA: hypothetical protein VHL53_13435 [Acidimicrobiia bacterium]|nr:hypothetical protein [Acidimicrobiia bacterium]
MKLQVATVLLQWAAGGLGLLWVTTRRREVGVGYGWTVRTTYLVMALFGAALGRWIEPEGTAALLRDLGAVGVAAAAGFALWQSFARRRAGVEGERTIRRARAARVAAMTGVTRPDRYDDTVPEFDPALDLIAPAVGVVALAAAAVAGGGPFVLGFARLVCGAAFLGAVTDAMLLGHAYLTQPGLSRDPLKQLVRINMWIWPVETVLFCLPRGMVQVVAGSIDDGANGLLGWIWLTSTISTIVLLFVTQAALRERWYSAVMAATGLLYLAILTGFGQDLVARAVLGR